MNSMIQPTQLYNPVIDASPGTSTGLSDFDRIYRYNVEEVLHPATGKSGSICQKIYTEASAEPPFFSGNMLVKSLKSSYFIRRLKNKYIMYDIENNRINKEHVIDLMAHSVEGPPEDSWIKHSWALNVSECDVSTNDPPVYAGAEDRINNLLQDLESSKPLDRPEEIAELAEILAAQLEEATQEENIKAWANQLSEKLSNFAD